LELLLLVIFNIFNTSINMIKNIIYLIIIIICSFGIRNLGGHPTLQFILALGWCITGAMLLYRIIDYLMKKFTK
jgi:hypothetical protein